MSRVMTSSKSTRVGRRRENVAGGRQHSHRVLVSAEEEAILVRLAAEKRITVPRLLMESALSPDRETPTQREDAIVELLELRGLLGEIAVGVRELVSQGAGGDIVSDAATEFIRRASDVAERLDATAIELAAR
jgi:hypothetical protein